MNNYSQREPTFHILIIGEVPFDLSFIFCLLTAQGYIIHSTIDGEQGLYMGKASSPALIIISTLIQSPDAYSLCEKIKATPSFKEVPVLFLNGENPHFKTVQVFKSGGFDYISHPFSAEEFLTRIRHSLTIVQLSNELQEKSIKLHNSLEELQKLENYIQEVYDELRSYSFLDSLTQIANKRSFEEYINREWRRCLRERVTKGDIEPLFLSLILCDVDYFKTYNDVYGMAAGDECLQKIAALIGEGAKRPADIVARQGGDSFLILLPNTNYEGAVTVVNVIREKLKDLQISHPYSPISDQITLSYGVVTCEPDKDSSPESLVQKSLEVLAKVKKEGGDKIFGETLSKHLRDEVINQPE
ncbi:MAG: diguanylate cyclase [Chlorogloea purpurea SAG 13.99]|nr:diguanylate cyclase [Chlorogloea purpurea SAG 13.99]